MTPVLVLFPLHHIAASKLWQNDLLKKNLSAYQGKSLWVHSLCSQRVRSPVKIKAVPGTTSLAFCAHRGPLADGSFIGRAQKP